MTYGLQCEALRFVGEMNPFVFAVFGSKRAVAQRAGEFWRVSVTFVPEDPRSGPLAVSSRGAMGSIASRRAGQKPPITALRLWSVFEAAPAVLRTRPPVGSPGRKKGCAKSALKSLKQLARVNLCAALKQGSEADDSR
jgi:hypothetical protein